MLGVPLVNHDWGGAEKDAQDRLSELMLILPLFLDLLTFLDGPWMQVHGGRLAGADIAAWPYSVGILCKFAAFLGTLHWPVGSEDMGHFGGFLSGTSDPFRAMGSSSVAQ